MKNKLYILTDNTLDPIYASVQGGHAVAQWLLDNWQTKRNKDFNEDYPTWEWNNDYLIYLSVDIEKWKELLWRFDPSKFKWTWFDEPDLNNKTTAIAIYEKDFPGIIKRKLKQEKLLKRDQFPSFYYFKY